MQFTSFNKATVAFVGAALVIFSLIFKQDLSSYGTLVSGIIAAVIPIAVYAVPNVAAEIADGGALQSLEDEGASIATTIGDALKPKA